MKARLTLLSGPRRGQRLLLQAPIEIGGEGAGAISLPSLPAGGIVARIEERDGAYIIVACGPHVSLAVNSRPVDQTVLHDGDLISIADRDTIRFGVVRGRDDAGKPLRAIVGSSLRAAAALDAGALRRSAFFLRDVCHCTACDATRRTKLACLVSCGLVVVAVGLVGASLWRTSVEAERRVIELSAEVAAGSASRQRLEQQLARLRQLELEKERTEARLGAVSQDLEAARQRLARLEREAPTLQSAIETARQSVAFVLVGFVLYETESGKPLRHAGVDANGNPEPDENGAYPTSVDGEGPIVTSYSSGSGFLIGNNRLVTNRHVAEPWRGEPSIDAAIRRGFEPRPTVRRAYFPGLRRPLDLRLVAVSEDADVALLHVTAPRGLTSLTLAPSERGIRTGDPIVVVGYPTGFDALLAKADEAVADEIIGEAGDDSPALAEQLGRRGLITPLVTLGHVGDVLPAKIVYDAATTHGSSGGPVLNTAGEIVAVMYGGLEEFAGVRFGIPIRFVHELVTRRPQPAGR